MHSDHLSSLKACTCLMFFDFCLWQRFMTPLAYLLKQPLSLPCLTFRFSWVYVSYLVDSISEVLFVWLLLFFFFPQKIREQQLVRRASQVAQLVKNPPAIVGDARDMSLIAE